METCSDLLAIRSSSIPADSTEEQRRAFERRLALNLQRSVVALSFKDNERALGSLDSPLVSMFSRYVLCSVWIAVHLLSSLILPCAFAIYLQSRV